MKALVLTLFFLRMAPSEAKKFSRCELASVLKQHGLDRYMGQLGKWICMSYASKYNTQTVSRPKELGPTYYGIFQILDFAWCSNDKHDLHSLCPIPCSALIDDDITDDIACAKRIMYDHVPLENEWLPGIKNCKGENMSKWSRGCKL